MAYKGVIYGKRVYCAYHPLCMASRPVGTVQLGWVCDYHKDSERW